MKTAIIGAGISGLYLGWKLAERGEEITIFERKKEIGNRACSGLFSQRILEFIPQSQKLIEKEIESVFIRFPKRTINLRFSKRFFLMSHFELDRLVSSLAQKAGAKIVLNQNIFSLPQGFERIIGSDGAGSFVRKKLGLPEPNFRLGIQIFSPELSLADSVDVWPCKNGFIWKIPRKKEMEYGIISDIQSAKDLLENFLEKSKISIREKRSKIIPQGFAIPSSPAVTLCGDSAGLTKPWSGGGVIWGLKAAKILLETFPDFLAYQKKMKRFFLPKIFLSKTAAKIVYFLGFKTPWILPKKVEIEPDFLI